MVEQSENVYVLFIANIDNLGAQDVFMVEAVVTALNCFMGICIVIDAELDGNVDRFHC